MFAGCEIPSHWRQGQLLDVRKFTDGSCEVGLWGEERTALRFASCWDAQHFVSAWYGRPDTNPLAR